MRKIIIIFYILSLQLSAQNEPVTTPIQWEGLDTLSKYYTSKGTACRAHAENENTGKGTLQCAPTTEPMVFENKEEEILGKLIEDPRVVFSTYFGGNGYDCSYGLAVDSKDFIYICGYTGSSDLPTTDNAIQKSKSGGHDAFVAKFTQEGQPVWITYYGGSGTDVALDMVCDSEDNIIICGKTNSTNLPEVQDSFKGESDCFLLKMDEDGNLIWAKYFGGERFESAEGIASTSENGFVITGYTISKDLPVSDDAFQNELKLRWDHGDTDSGDPDAFLTKFDKDGNMVYSTYYGGKGDVVSHAVAVDNEDNIAFTGYIFECGDFPVTADAFQKDTAGAEDCFIVKFSSSGEREWATLMGGQNKEKFKCLFYDAKGNFYLSGYTLSNDFPVSDNAYQPTINGLANAIIAKFNNNGTRIWSTYFGGNSGEEAISMYINNNFLWITGYTQSLDLPASENALPNFYPEDWRPNVYLLQMNLEGYPVWVSYYSGGLNDFGYNILYQYQNKNLIFTGETHSRSFPITSNAFQEDRGNGDYAGFLVNVNVEGTPVEEIPDNNHIGIYPNPASYYLFVKTNGFSKYSISVINILGQKKVNYPNLAFDNGIEMIDISTLTSGYYLVLIETKTDKYSIPLLKQ
ncbi:SBBP repeat-containing protein [Bacteroidota bacterium]